jgi:ATP/maltotriose-dependent transcriptional regulator MalT/DNA-binding SARP family transcriptional activator
VQRPSYAGSQAEDEFLAARTPALAKLTRPKLYDALPRPRLFERLDAARERPVVCITAPPGSGKSTLVASYTEARGLPYLWYQVDAGDSDPATFMHYLRLAAQSLVGKRGGALPVFTSEPQQDLGRFVRSFCRDLFAALPRGTLVVVDNFQEARSSAEQRAAFAAGLEEIPEGINVVVLSRTDPPQEFARLVGRRQIARIDVDDLRCTEDEALAILGGTPLDRDAVRRIQSQSDGWVAALVLLREHLSRPDAAVEESLGEGREAIVQYFAGEIFARAKPANQRALMITAMLPSVTTAEAADLVGRDDVARLLEYLYRRHLFVDRRRGAQTTWHYHALFREFLQEEGRRRLAAAERRALCARAAALLEARGEDDGALALYREAGEFEAMRGLILVHALDWARHGRSQALSDAIEALPEAMRASDPWLEYWHGRAWIFVEPQRGRASLERAFDAFKRAGDRRGQALALNTIVTGHYYEWANFAPIDRWMPEFAELLDDRHGPPLDAASELRLRSAWLIALLFRRPDDPALGPCARRLDELVDAEPDPNARIMAASVLFNYLNWCTKGEEAEALVARTEPVLSRPEAAPLMQLWWRTHLAFWHYVNGRYDRSQAVADEARAIAERYGLAAYLFEIDHAEASALVTRGALAEAQVRMTAIESRLSPSRRMDHAYFHHLKANLEQRLGHFTAAVRAAERAVALARETGLPAMQLPHFLVRLAHARIAAGEATEGLKAFDEAIALAGDVDRRSFTQQRELIGIGLDLEAGDTERGAARLATVLAEYRRNSQTVILRNRPDLAARLADFALARGIETDFVRLLIERNGLQAPPGAGLAWPFRLRVRVLGGFELARDGEPVRFTGKAQQRPLDLLRYVMAEGGAGVDTAAAMGALWPDADGDAAKASFDAALFRLRKLLDVDRAVQLTGGKLSLAPELVWTDVRALEAALDATRCATETRVDAGALARAARALLAAYPGALLATEDAPWLAKPRDAWRARVLRALAALGSELEAARDWSTAIDVYRRGLEADNLAEPLYRGLMRSLAATGERAEALVAFRRCRELLPVVLGLTPSAETERLYREITSGAFPQGAAPPA